MIRRSVTVLSFPTSSFLRARSLLRPPRVDRSEIGRGKSGRRYDFVPRVRFGILTLPLGVRRIRSVRQKNFERHMVIRRTSISEAGFLLSVLSAIWMEMERRRVLNWRTELIRKPESAQRRAECIPSTILSEKMKERRKQMAGLMLKKMLVGLI